MQDREDGQASEGKQPGDAGTVSMFKLRYCFGRPALTLTEEETKVYIQMMAALGQSPYDVYKVL